MISVQTTGVRVTPNRSVWVALAIGACGGGPLHGGTEAPTDASVDGGASVNRGAPIAEAGLPDHRVPALSDGAIGVDSGCAAPAVICGGACVTGTCAFAVTGVSALTPTGLAAADWISGGDFFTVTGSGFTAGMQLTLGDGRAPLRVSSSTSATIQAPPGPEGPVDVTISLGTQQSTTHGVFSYVRSSVDSTGQWVDIEMSTAHGDMPAIATTIDGRALVTGGFTSFTPEALSMTADLFSLGATATVAASGLMHTIRWDHTMVTLLDGRTAVLGGDDNFDTSSDSAVVDLFDPATNTFTVATGSPPMTPFTAPRGVLLVDGTVLLLSPYVPAQIFDPETESFAPVAGAPTVGDWQVSGFSLLTRLRDGRVLIVTGQGGDAYVYDSDAQTFTSIGTGPAAGPDGLFTLPDGRVMAVGGSNASGGVSQATAVIELWDPQGTTGFAPASYTLALPHVASATGIERDGTVLVMGGNTTSYPDPYACGTTTSESLTPNVEQVDPVAGTVTPFAMLPEATSFFVATTMPDGSIVAAGGADCALATPYKHLYFRQAPAFVQPK